MWRGLALAALVAGAAAVPSAAEAGDEAIAYTCSEAETTDLGLPSFSAEVGVTATDVPDPAKVFQPVTWTFDLAEPELAPPLPVDLHFLRVRVPIPEGLTNVTASAVAATGETPNPALSAVSVQVTGGEVVVQLPATPSTSNRIFAGTDGSLKYPHAEGNLLSLGNPVVLPLVRVVGTPTPDLAGTNVEWQAPTIESKANVAALGGSPDVVCEPDLDPDPVVAATAVSTQRQLCDGRAVNVQLGFNTPTAGSDVIQGTPAADTANGLGGGDRFCGLAGIDTFRGGPGNDRAVGGAGNDKLFGDAGDDRLQGDAGTDTLNGGAGRDALVGGTQRDTCIGGTQRDTAATCEVRQSIP
jgi:hypothetical protein